MYTAVAVYPSHGGGHRGSGRYQDAYFEEEQKCQRRGQKQGRNSKLLKKMARKISLPQKKC